MDKKNYQKPSMKAVELKTKHLICGTPGPGPSNAREYRGGLDDSGVIE